MSGTGRYSVPILASLCLLFLTPQLVRGQILVYFEADISLSAKTNQQGTTVISSATVTLYRGSDAQRLTSQVIMGHAIKNLSLNSAVVYQNRRVSDTGVASETAFIGGVVGHCYQTDVGAHANEYNRHEVFMVGPICAEAYEPPPKPDPPDENCPVLLDLDQNGFHLSGPDPAVSFDIDADGAGDRIAWTRANDDDAFLCMDRNHNGVIDNGRELFGYATLLRDGQPAQIGYRALAELDSPEAGGNGDGKVDARDQSYPSLCAWNDANRDGVSQSHEIRGLEESGVIALSYDYRTTRLRDAYGNLFRYVSRADMRAPSGALRSWPTFDVIFVSQ